MRETFKNNNNQFFTHTLKNEQKIKFVLYGLHPVTTEELKLELNTYPLEIKKLNIKNVKFENQTIYLLYFTKASKTQLSELKKIRSLFHIIVKFDYFKNKRTGPTQCANCQSFGHGQEYCFKMPQCMRCGENHKSSQCFHHSTQTDGKK